MPGDWILTYTGRQFRPTSPRAADVDVADVAHALSNLCRFTGHCHRFYSVAEHCVIVSHLVPPQFALWGLLHDAAEAYVNDLAGPLKHDDLLRGYCEAEDRVVAAVAERFGLALPMPEEVHLVDRALAYDERADLFPGQGHVREKGVSSLGLKVYGGIGAYSPRTAERLYLARFYQLTEGRVL